MVHCPPPLWIEIDHEDQPVTGLGRGKRLIIMGTRIDESIILPTAESLTAYALLLKQYIYK